MRVISLIALICCTMTFLAHEFIQKREPKHISLQKVKDQFGDLFAQQLRETASIVQLIGCVQKVGIKDVSLPSTQSIHDVANTLHVYSIQLADLVHAVPPVPTVHFPASMSLCQLLAELTITIGLIQQGLIEHLNDLIEEKGNIFIKQHVSLLADLVPTIKTYDMQLQKLKKMLTDIEHIAHEKRCGVQKIDSDEQKKSLVKSDFCATVG